MEFEVMGITYRARKIIGAKQAWNVVRRILPVFGVAVGGAIKGVQLKKELADMPIDEAIGFLASGLGEMSDENSNYIIDNLLKNAQRKSENDIGWADLVADNGLIMFQDITWTAQLMICFKVLVFNMSDFFDILPSNAAEALRKVTKNLTV
jgi:hypothetical protein